MSGWWSYVERVAGTSVQKEITDVSGIGGAVLSRWKSGQHAPTASNAIDFARAYNRPPVEALIAADILTVDDVPGAVEVPVAPTSLTNDELLAVVRSRMQSPTAERTRTAFQRQAAKKRRDG